MCTQENIANRRLFFFGIGAIAVANSLVLLLNRAGRSSDLTDLGVGGLFGVGIGLMILVVWRSASRRRGGENGGRTR